MPEHTMDYRGLIYVIGTSSGGKSTWNVFVDGKATLTGHERSTGKSSAFRTAIHQAQAAIDAMLGEEQAA